VRHSGASQHQIGAHPVHLERGAHRSDPAQLAIRKRHRRQRGPGHHDPFSERGVLGTPDRRETSWVRLVAQPTAYHFGPRLDITGGRHLDGEPEAIQQLRA
jgi:hypothetical protein